MKKHFSKKRVVLLAIVAIVLGVGVGAYAYFTTTGSGTGSASVGTSSAVTIHGTAVDLLYPGTDSEVDFTLDNPSSGHQWVSTISLDSVDTGDPGCDPAWFSMPDVTVDQDFGNGDGQVVTATGTLSMENANESQDACKDADLTLNLSSN